MTSASAKENAIWAIGMIEGFLLARMTPWSTRGFLGWFGSYAAVNVAVWMWRWRKETGRK